MVAVADLRDHMQVHVSLSFDPPFGISVTDSFTSVELETGGKLFKSTPKHIH